MADSVNFSGLSSGIDSTSLIKALVDAKRQPIVLLQAQADEYQANITRMDDFAGKLTTLRSAAQTLATASSFSAFSTSTSNSDVMTVAASTSASEGNHTVVVQQLAAGQTSKSDQTSVSANNPFGLDGKLTLTPAAGTNVSVPVNQVSFLATDSLSAIRDKINNSTPTAYGSLSFLAVPTSGTKLAIDDKTYEFYDSGAGAYSGTNIGVDVNGATSDVVATRLASAAAGTGSLMTTIGSVITVKAKTAGSGGNLIGMTNTNAAGGTDGAIQMSGTKLSGGIPSYSAGLINSGTTAAPSWSLVLSGKSMGEVSAFTTNYTPTVPGDPKTLSFANVQTARDSIIDIDGMNGIRRSTNVITDVIAGVTMNLVDAPADKKAVSIGVAKDNGAIRSKVDAFIKAYNDIASYIRTNSQYDATTKKAGPLQGDLAISTVSNGLSSSLVNSVSGLGGNYNALSRVGIRTGSDGTLTMDTAKFDTAMSADFKGVVDLFTKNLTTGTKGVASQIMDKVDRWMSPVDGIVANRKKSLQTNITNINASVTQKESSVTLYEASLKVKFANMEQLIGSLKSQGQTLGSI